MTALTLALRNLSIWHPRNIGALAGIMIAVASLVALIGLARGVQESLASALVNRGTDALVTEAGAFDLISSILMEETAMALAKQPGVTAVAPELSRLTTLRDGRSVAVTAWPVGTFPWDSLKVTDGRLPATGDGQVAVIGQSLATRAGFAVGDRIELFHTEFQVVGLVTAQSVLGRSLVYAALPVVQELTFRDGQVTSVGLQLDKDQSAETLTQLRDGFPALNIEATADLSDSYFFGQIARVLALTISTVAMLSAVLVIFTTMSTAVNARRGELAILSAIGWPRQRIVASLLIEGAVLSAIAGVLGILGGALGAQVVTALPSITGYIAPVIGPVLLVQAFLVSMAVGLLGTVIPALRATARAPADILRSR
ncbi:MAG: ABC transporter permease [Paracoccaceae bacterium]|nr:ABC transporter permease [Paracoccaceae bacterium]